MPQPTPLLVTIDTECDKTATWHTASPLSFRGITVGIPIILDPLFKDYGVRPTYLLSQEVMENPACVEALRSLTDSELGTHLHGEYVAPANIVGDLGGTITSEMQWEYGYALERQKLTTLTDTFVSCFGFRPRSFRAGRFGVGPHTGRALLELGYDVESSVTPHLSWPSRLGTHCPDFRACPEMPYRVAESGNVFETGGSRLLELPITILQQAGDPARPLWFRPWYSSMEVLAAIVEHVIAGNQRAETPRPLVMMFHNMEIIPGASPYPQTIADVELYARMLRHTFDRAVSLGAVPMTMAEYFDRHWAGR